jgi:hypothetical protein
MRRSVDADRRTFHGRRQLEVPQNSVFGDGDARCLSPRLAGESVARGGLSPELHHADAEPPKLGASIVKIGAP